MDSSIRNTGSAAPLFSKAGSSLRSMDWDEGWRNTKRSGSDRSRNRRFQRCDGQGYCLGMFAFSFSLRFGLDGRVKRLRLKVLKSNGCSRKSRSDLGSRVNGNAQPLKVSEAKGGIRGRRDGRPDQPPSSAKFKAPGGRLDSNIPLDVFAKISDFSFGVVRGESSDDIGRISVNAKGGFECGELLFKSSDRPRAFLLEGTEITNTGQGVQHFIFSKIFPINTQPDVFEGVREFDRSINNNRAGFGKRKNFLGILFNRIRKVNA